jgi:uncharacterized DUF497 family protein
VESTFDPKKNAAHLHKHGVPLSDGEGVRIISVRRPEPKEVRAYEEDL